MRAAEIMTRSVITVTPDTPIADAVNLMLEKRISGLPVVDAAGALVGVVSEGDFLRRTETGTTKQRPRWIEFVLGPQRGADDYVRSHGRKVSEVMTAKVETIAEDTPLADVVTIMEKRHIKRLPVVKDGRLVGIVSRANLLHALAAVHDKAQPEIAGDTGIRAHILAEIDKESWAPKSSINVVVRNGVVNFYGTLFDGKQREALKVIAENTPGVKSVADHTAWVDPVSGTLIDTP